MMTLYQFLNIFFLHFYEKKYLIRLEVEKNKYKALKRQNFIDMLNHETTDARISFRPVLLRGDTLEHC